MEEPNESFSLLVELLKEAATLEHCLLNTYLYTAYTLKSTPQEFEKLNDLPNRRRAIQFERVRLWKQTILSVATEEMLHLHYVQCLLRALGESPAFNLPKKDPTSGEWMIKNWQAKIGSDPVNEGKGMRVNLESFSPKAISSFVLYEATDSLQDANPFGQRITALFERLFDIELDLYFEKVLVSISDDSKRNKLKSKLIHLYTSLTPLPESPAELTELLKVELEGLPPLEEIIFQSIADLYLKGILPLYQEAFDNKWVKFQNRDLNDELLDPDIAQEGFIGFGPVYRSKNFEDNSQNPLRNFKAAESIIKEIVEEGEGFSGFEEKAKDFIVKIGELKGTRAYLLALKADKSGPAKKSPNWLANAEEIRQSHLYRFAMILMEIKREKALAKEVGADFDPARKPIPITGDSLLEKLNAEIPAYFNATYLVLVMWLSRIYELREWKSDVPRRKAIEMLASWPMMSIAIRPFLELAAFLPIDLKQLFRLDSRGLPMLPIHSQELRQLYENKERSEEINERLDCLGLKVLSDVAGWAIEKLESLKKSHSKESDMILTRLEALTHLDEFEKQFPFRMHGGYSGVAPDRYFQETASHPQRFEEDPTLSNYSPDPDHIHLPLFKNALVLKLSFSGWGLIQLPTDPDPPTDEAGCTGTQMFHSSDGNKKFDRALVWQKSNPGNIILREPVKELPEIGVRAAEVCLLATQSATAGLKPLGSMQSTGAVQTSGVQQELAVDGFSKILTLNLKDLDPVSINLRDKKGIKPVLQGDNHLMWKDGEPIDPFIISIGLGRDKKNQVIFEREIYNEGLSVREMSPLQRVFSGRGPVGFDKYNNIPGWAFSTMSSKQQELLRSPNYPGSYLQYRYESLLNSLENLLAGPDIVTQSAVDDVASLCERTRRVSNPARTTSGWLTILLHYGHTVSGDMNTEKENVLFQKISDLTGMKLEVKDEKDRKKANSRWLIGYTKGIMDTDAISDFIYGDIYIPLDVKPGTENILLEKIWEFEPEMKDLIVHYACNFQKPFWAVYQVNGDTRILESGDLKLTEKLVDQNDAAYRYELSGLDGLSNYTGYFQTTQDNNKIRLKYSASFRCTDPSGIVNVCNYFGNVIQAMEQSLKKQFSPL
jgi:hypothetical protein